MTAYYSLYTLRRNRLLGSAYSSHLTPDNQDMRAFQESEKLSDENYLMRAISEKITEKITDKEIRFSFHAKDFEGDLSFEIEL